MNGIYYYLIAFGVIWILAAIFHEKLSNHGFEIDFPIIMWKTQRLRGFLTKISNLSPRFWRWFMNVGIIVAYGAMIFITGTLLSTLPSVFDTPAVSIVIPGVEMPGSSIYVPFVYGIIALAFVEPDEEKLKSAKKTSRLRVYAAGSIANISLAIIALLLFSLISAGIPNYFAEDGIEIDRIVSDSPSDGILKEGMVLQAIDGVKINDSQSYVDTVGSFKPGDNISVQTDQGTYSVALGKNPNNESVGFFGIQANKHFKLVDDSLGPLPWVLFELLDLFQWIFMLNLGIGLFNLLPIKPLDGGYMLQILLSYKMSEEKYIPIVNALSVVLAMVIVFSLVASFI